jgi:hypothetical protein
MEGGETSRMMFLVVLLLLAMCALLIGLYAVLAELDDGRGRYEQTTKKNSRTTGKGKSHNTDGEGTRRENNQ